MYWKSIHLQPTISVFSRLLITNITTIMNKIEISINPMAEFLEATESRKKRIITEQLDPDPVRIPYYQKARSVIAKSILLNGDMNIIEDAIPQIAGRIVEKDWQRNDKVNSLKVLNLWKGMNLPEKFTNNKLIKISTKAKFFPLFGIQIKVSPTAIFKIEIDGQTYIGAFKIHLSKGKPFNVKQSAFVAQLLNLFLNNFVVREDEIVDPQLCLCIDPFSGTMVSASNKIKYDVNQLKQACQEIASIYDDNSLEQSVEVA